LSDACVSKTSTDVIDDCDSTWANERLEFAPKRLVSEMKGEKMMPSVRTVIALMCRKILFLLPLLIKIFLTRLPLEPSNLPEANITLSFKYIFRNDKKALSSWAIYK
jgi:hypothetical protein